MTIGCRVLWFVAAVAMLIRSETAPAAPDSVAASLMLNHGIPVLIVSKRLGHSKPSIPLDVYGHLIPSRQEEAAQLMDNLMFQLYPP